VKWLKSGTKFELNLIRNARAGIKQARADKKKQDEEKKTLSNVRQLKPKK